MTIAFHPEFRPALISVLGSKDYLDFRDTLIEMDRILTETGLEHIFIQNRLAAMGAMRDKANLFHYRTMRLALRYSILLGITGNSYRELSRRVADSQVFQWFTHTALLDQVRPVSKSSIARFDKMFTTEEVAELIHNLNGLMADEVTASNLLYQETALKFDKIFADTTCVKANIHYPVDWKLLSDASCTLMNVIIMIRKHGIKYRISDPKRFLRNMNKLCIEMTHARKKVGASKIRKKIFRRMKRLMKTIETHARNYYNELESRWQETDLSEVETQIILDRITNILDQLPQAVHQAHERIIGGRRIANKDKILSLYDPDINVLIRGKSDAEVEFGNGLYLAEQENGLIVDWKFIQEQPPGDNKLTPESIKRITEEYGKPESYAADRGFDSSDNRLDLEELGIINAICPRSVPLMIEKLEDDIFCILQKRRGATEARIGIFKNVYLGKPLRSKGFKNRQVRIEWCILAHNLWKLASMAAQRRKENEMELAKAA